MILLLGGTAEAALIAKALMEEGFEVLLSTATDIPSRGGLGPGIRLRTGDLDARGIEDLIGGEAIDALVDATHPYAKAISANAWTASRRMEIPYVAFDRPASVTEGPGIYWAGDHDQAALLACLFERPLLLTIGVRNLAPYVAAARLHGLRLVARVLDHPSSMESCRLAGLHPGEIVHANGPFTVEANAALIQEHGIGVLVTKDSGEAGGVPAKIAAARDAECRVVVIRRPPRPETGHSSIPALIKALRASLASQKGKASAPSPKAPSTDHSSTLPLSKERIGEGEQWGGQGVIIPKATESYGKGCHGMGPKKH